MKTPILYFLTEDCPPQAIAVLPYIDKHCNVGKCILTINLVIYLWFVICVKLVLNVRTVLQSIISTHLPSPLCLATNTFIGLTTASAVKGLWDTGSPAHRPDGYTMLMSPNKGETAVHGCHRAGDMVVRMRKVLARPWVSVCMSLTLNCL